MCKYTVCEFITYCLKSLEWITGSNFEFEVLPADERTEAFGENAEWWRELLSSWAAKVWFACLNITSIVQTVYSKFLFVSSIWQTGNQSNYIPHYVFFRTERITCLMSSKGISLNVLLIKAGAAACCQAALHTELISSWRSHQNSGRWLFNREKLKLDKENTVILSIVME